MAESLAKAQNLAQTMNATPAADLPKAAVVDEQTILNALQTLRKYQDSKAALTERLQANEDWWRIRHWNRLDSYGNKGEERPASAWLFNTIISKHAELMDAYPTFNCLPREANDQEEAKRLSEILPVVLKQNKFEGVYSDEGWTKLKSGTGIYGAFWDSNKLNGLGDIRIANINPLNLYWQPGINDIQASKNIFYTQDVDNDTLIAMYPELEGKVGGRELVNDQVVNNESRVDQAEKTMVVDWYYKKNVDGRTILHYCKFCNGVLLFASENEPENYPLGWYEHGKYPFIVDALFPVEGNIAGFGYIDVCREPQKYIDLVSQGIAESAMLGSKPRFFIRKDGSVNEDEFGDITKPFVHVEGSLGEDSIRQIVTQGLDPMYLNYVAQKIEEMKETAGNRDVANGGTTSGVTAASAIAAMQEQSGKTSRDSTKASYRAYEELITQCIELIRQFYDMPRQFRIVGTNGAEEFIEYTNAGIQPSPVDGLDGQIGMRIPVFDLEIIAQQENAYTKMSQNELALQFYQMGFFNPELVDQALACIDMMDFKGKNEVVQKLRNNGGMYQQLMMWQQMAITLANKYGDPMAQGLAQASGQPDMIAQSGGNAAAPEIFTEGKKEGKRMEKARAEANSSYTPQ